jgi:hypothetical protein
MEINRRKEIRIANIQYRINFLYNLINTSDLLTSLFQVVDKNTNRNAFL